MIQFTRKIHERGSKNVKLTRICRGLTFVFTSTLMFGITAASLLETNKDAIDGYFNTHSSILKQKGDGKFYSAFTPDKEYLTEDGKGNSKALVEAHETLSRQIAGEGTVLLKNSKDALPLKTSNENKLKVSLFGVRSSATITGAFIGSSSSGNNQTVHFKDALTEAGFDVNPTLSEAYDSYVSEMQKKRVLLENDYPLQSPYLFGQPGFSSFEATMADLNSKNAEAESSVASYNEVGIVVLGRAASEGLDWHKNQVNPAMGTANPMQITKNEQAIIDFAKEKCQKVIVVINAINPMEIQSLEDDEKISGILWMGIGGSYATRGVADILSGKVNPSGHLSDIYASNSQSAPAMVNYGDYSYSNSDDKFITRTNPQLKSTKAYVVEAEGIYTGYKYYETRYYDYALNQGNARSSIGSSYEGNWEYKKEVTYGFGYGLSYTTFTQEISAPTVSHGAHDFTLEFTVKVTNTGSVAGKDVVQLYAQAPYLASGVEKAAIQLVAFDKTKTLEPKESQTLKIKVDMQNLASYDSSAKNGNGSYILDKGDYYFALGNGAHEAVNNVLASQGYSMTSENGITENGKTNQVYKYNYNIASVDEDTFNVSKSGVQVKNQLADADLNTWKKDTVTYLSRNDWEHTWPKEYKDLEATEEMIKVINGGMYELKDDEDSSSILFNQSGSMKYTDLKGTDYSYSDWDTLLNQLDLEEAMNFILHGNRDFLAMDSVGFLAGKFTENGPNGVGDRAFKTLSYDNFGENKPTWYIDENDENAKFEMRVFPSAPVMAATFNNELAYAQGKLMGNDALFVGLTILWGPSMNTHRTGYNGRNLEYYSEDPILTGSLAMEYSIGALDKGLIAAPKHFAFNDQETNRAGVSPYLTEQRARENELRAFQIAFEATKYDTDEKDVGLLGVMTSFSKIGPCEVTCHEGLLSGILRGEWGYRGYIVSDLEDDTDYFAQAINAGITSWDSTNTIDKISVNVADIKKDKNILKKIKDAVHCNLWVLTQSNYMNMVDSNSEMVYNMTWWRALYISIIAVSGAGVAFGLLGTTIPACLKKKKGE